MIKIPPTQSELRQQLEELAGRYQSAYNQIHRQALRLEIKYLQFRLNRINRRIEIEKRHVSDG